MLTAPYLVVVPLVLLVLLWMSSTWVYGKAGQIARSVVLRFFLTVAGPIACIMALPLFLVALLFELDERIWQAVIAGLFIATGWLTTTVFAEQGKLRVRAERTRDYHKAIYAEIGNTLESLWEPDTSEAYVTALIDRMKENPDYIPFIPREHHDHIYDAVIAEIDVLPRQTIDAIVAYYSLIKSLAALVEDMRGDSFKALEQHRRVAMYSDYVGMRKQAFLFGKYALRLIKAYSDGGPEAAERVINTRDADPSAMSQGSA